MLDGAEAEGGGGEQGRAGRLALPEERGRVAHLGDAVLHAIEHGESRNQLARREDVDDEPALRHRRDALRETARRDAGTRQVARPGRRHAPAHHLAMRQRRSRSEVIPAPARPASAARRLVRAWSSVGHLLVLESWRAAASGSGAAQMAETTAMPFTPEARTAGALARLIPPIATVGRGAMRTSAASRRHPAAVVVGLGACRVDRADASSRPRPAGRLRTPAAYRPRGR